MTTRIVINGKEVTNPAAKALIGMLAILVAGIVAAAVIFLVLPLVGIAVTLTVGLVGVLLVALGVGIPVIILGGTLIAALLAPLAMRRKARFEKEDDSQPRLPRRTERSGPNGEGQ